MGSVDFPDAELVRRSKHGDLSSYEEIFNRYRKRVYNLIYRMVSDENDAADLTQEVFVKVYTMLPTLKADRAFYSWLRTVATNTVLDYLRRRPAGRIESLDQKAELGDDRSVDREIPSTDEGPAKAAERMDLQSAVREAVQSLASEHRAVVVLHHLEGLDVHEIASMLGVPDGTVKSRLARAREHLKRKLGAFVEV